MVVTDSKLEDATRPVFLTFAGDVEPGEPFAHMVENRRLIDALVQRAEAEGVDLRPTAVSTYDARSDGVTVTLADGQVIEASLLVAADGARSRLRERAGIATHGLLTWTDNAFEPAGMPCSEIGLCLDLPCLSVQAGLHPESCRFTKNFARQAMAAGECRAINDLPGRPAPTRPPRHPRPR